MFFRRLLRFLGCGVILVVLGLVFRQYKMWLAKSDTFSIRKIEIQGADLLTEEEILETCGLSSQTSLWHVDLAGATQKIESCPFVERVHVVRRQPDILRIRVEEKRPVALLNFKGGFYSLDRDGLVLPSRPGKLYDLPVLSGDFQGGVSVGSRVGGKLVREGLRFLMQVLEDRPGLTRGISEILVGGPERLTLYTSRGGIPVWVDEEGYAWKIRYLEAILDELSREDRFSEVGYIDLRFMGQIVVGMRT